MALTVLLTVGLGLVAHQASAAVGTNADLELTRGPEEQLSASEDLVTVRYTFIVRSAGPDDLTRYNVSVGLSSRNSVVNILNPDGSVGRSCVNSTPPTCDHTIVANLPARTGQTFRVDVTVRPSATFTVTVAPSGVDADTSDNSVRVIHRFPVTDLVLASTSVTKQSEFETSVTMRYGYSVQNSGPAPVTILDFVVEAPQASEIRISAPAGSGGFVCRAAQICHFQLTGQVFQPGATLATEVRISALGGSRATIKVLPQWSSDPVAENNVNSVTLPLATGG